MAKRPGKLKQRVEVWLEVLTVDTLRGATSVPTLVKTTWADIRIDTGARGLEFLQAKNERPHIITMREDIDINPNSNYLEWEGIRLTIQSVDPDPDRKKYQVIRASQKIV